MRYFIVMGNPVKQENEPDPQFFLQESWLEINEALYNELLNPEAIGVIEIL